MISKLDELWRSAVLGAVQGLTEFLPISSSFHLRLVPVLLGWPETNISFAAFLHLGTLFAVLIYFGRDLFTIGEEFFTLLRAGNFGKLLGSMGFKILIGSIPAVLLGYFFNDFFDKVGEDFWIMSSCLVLVGLVLWVSDLQAVRKTSLAEMSILDGLLIGIGQSLALIPGVSRSGSTISFGRLLGMSRADAARFSFLLGAPVVLGAGLFETVKLARDFDSGILLTCLVGFVTSATVGYFAIDFLLKYLQSSSLLPFVLYRVIVGGVVLLLTKQGIIK